MITYNNKILLVIAAANVKMSLMSHHDFGPFRIHDLEGGGFDLNLKSFPDFSTALKVWGMG